MRKEFLNVIAWCLFVLGAVNILAAAERFSAGRSFVFVNELFNWILVGIWLALWWRWKA